MLGVMALSLGLTQLSTPSAPNAGRPQAAAAAGTVFAARRLFADMQFELISRLRVGSTAIGLVEGQDFDIRPSRGKGLGVYALRDIPAGTLLGRYTGKLYTLREADEALAAGETSGDYFYLLHKERSLLEPMILDAEGDQQSWCRFVNHSKRRANCDLLEVEEPIGPFTLPLDIVVMVSTRAIASGSELLFDYGSDYWDNRLGQNRWSPRRLIIDYL